MRTILVIILIAFLLPPAVAKSKKKNEKYYQERWCKGRGVTEHILPDRTRVDCLTSEHAIEFDWGNKWAESIGQSLYYSLQTGKRGGCCVDSEEEKALSILDTP